MSFNEQNSREQYGRKNSQQQKQQKSNSSKPLDSTNNQPESYEL